MRRISGRAQRAIAASIITAFTFGAARANVFVMYSNTLPVAAEASILDTLTGGAAASEPTLKTPVTEEDLEVTATASANTSTSQPFSGIADPFAKVSMTPFLPVGAGSITFGATAEVVYFFSVTQATYGPQPSTIAVDVVGSFQGGDPTMVTTASVDVYNQNQVLIASQTEYQNNSKPLPGPPYVSNPFTLTFNATPGVVYEVVAEASGGGCISIITEGICSTPASRYTGTYTSEVDPYVTVDPSMAGNYDLTLSSGLAPPASGAAPEAGTWGMMLTGFAGLGFVGYWRKRKSGAPTLAV